MKKKKLKFSYTPDIEVFGVSTSLKGYQLCWHLGNVFGLDFQKIEDNILPKPHKMPFNCYKHLVQETEILYVIENENNGSFYQAKYKIADFFVVRYVDFSLQQVENIKEAVKKIPQVQTVFEIDVSKPKDAEPFMFEE